MAVSGIAALIEECKDRSRGPSGQRLTDERIAERGGGDFTKQRVQQIRTQPVRRHPGPDTIEKLARGLDVDRGLVEFAYSLSLGIQGAGHVPAQWLDWAALQRKQATRYRTLALGQDLAAEAPDPEGPEFGA